MALGTADSILPPYNTLSEDPLPQYSCNTSLIGNLLFKQELQTPNQAAYQRQWRKVRGEVRGTLLIITTATKEATPSTTRRYTLQAADVGIATDYVRRSNAIRVRAEGEQFLLATSNLLNVILWIEKLSAAIAISLDLDERELPSYRTVPKRRPSMPARAFRPEPELRVQELWWTRRRESCWLAQSQPSLDGETLGVQSLPAGEESRPSMGGNLKEQRNRDLRSRNTSMDSTGATSRASYWSRILLPSFDSQPSHTSRVEQDTRGSEGDTARDLQCHSVDRNGKWFPETISLHLDDKLDYACQCARKLRYGSSWKGGYYIRGDQIVPIHFRMTAAYRNPHYQQWD